MAPIQEFSLRMTYYTARYPGELSDDERRLVDAARLSATRAYAPYSKFQVGAAVLMDNGEIMDGSNQENAAFPSGLCAERVAIFQAGHRWPDVPVRAVAVAVQSAYYQLSEAIFPCGACRQAMLEYENRFGRPIRVLVNGPDNTITIVPSVADLLPFAFNGTFLKGD
jgi:cytidine deaminase